MPPSARPSLPSSQAGTYSNPIPGLRRILPDDEHPLAADQRRHARGATGPHSDARVIRDSDPPDIDVSGALAGAAIGSADPPRPRARCTQLPLDHDICHLGTCRRHAKNRAHAPALPADPNRQASERRLGTGCRRLGESADCSRSHGQDRLPRRRLDSHLRLARIAGRVP